MEATPPAGRFHLAESPGTDIDEQPASRLRIAHDISLGPMVCDGKLEFLAISLVSTSNDAQGKKFTILCTYHQNLALIIQISA